MPGDSKNYRKSQNCKSSQAESARITVLNV